MKAIIPLAGKGTRLRPHTYVTPKPLLKVGGRPVMSYILDDLRSLGVEEIVFVVGYLRDAVRDYIEEDYPDVKAHYVVQEVQDGTAGAVRLAAPYVDEDVLIVFVDTLFDADLSLVRGLTEEWAGVIWAKEVEDYQRYGVILTDDGGAMTRIVEKPSEPISKLANIGLYYIRDYALLFEGIEHTMNAEPGPAGEFYLTDAFQYMVDHGARIRTAPVAGWYDCGKLETLLDTNRHLLETTRGGRRPGRRAREHHSGRPRPHRGRRGGARFDRRPQCDHRGRRASGAMHDHGHGGGRPGGTGILYDREVARGRPGARSWVRGQPQRGRRFRHRGLRPFDARFGQVRRRRSPARP